LNEYLYYPQSFLTKEERDLNFFIAKEVFNKDVTTEVKCYIDIESGMTDIAMSHSTIKQYSQFEKILILPAYLDHEDCYTIDSFFKELVYINDDKNFGNYDKQKKTFCKTAIEQDGYHISSFKLIPNYCNYLEAINFSIKKSIKDKLITENQFISSLKKIINSEKEYDCVICTAIEKAKALCNALQWNTTKIDKKNVLCFYSKKK
jgi:hypothetical protein